MKRGPLIHGVLLVAALLFAYQTWTREEKIEPTTGDVVLWSIPSTAITGARYEIDQDEQRVVRLERRRDEHGSYLWGWETRMVTETVANRDGPPPPKNEAGFPIREVETRDVSNTREFAVGKKGEETFEKLAEMRALRDLGVITDEQKERYELTDDTEYIEVTYEGGRHRLLLGGKVFGGADRYALDPETGRAYAISYDLIRNLMSGETTLRLLRLHQYEKKHLGKAIVEVGGQKRTLVRIEVPDQSGQEHLTWADAATPDKPDQTMANFLRSIDRLRPAIYDSERSTDEMKRLVRVEYQRSSGETLGWIELYERPPQEKAEEEAEEGEAATTDEGEGEAQAEAATTTDEGESETQAAERTQDKARKADQRKSEARPTYYMRTEMTRVLAAVPHNLATRITEDIDQIFSQ